MKWYASVWPIKQVERPEDVNASLIKKLNVNCRFSTSFKENINKAEFVPAAKFQKD